MQAAQLFHLVHDGLGIMFPLGHHIVHTPRRRGWEAVALAVAGEDGVPEANQASLHQDRGREQVWQNATRSLYKRRQSFAQVSVDKVILLEMYQQLARASVKVMERAPASPTNLCKHAELVLSLD